MGSEMCIRDRPASLHAFVFSSKCMQVYRQLLSSKCMKVHASLQGIVCMQSHANLQALAFNNQIVYRIGSTAPSSLDSPSTQAIACKCVQVACNCMQVACKYMQVACKKLKLRVHASCVQAIACKLRASCMKAHTSSKKEVHASTCTHM